MSEAEDPALTLMRLLRTKMRVTKDNNALASVYVSGEWQNADALKNVDGQVTVGLADSVDQKIELTGKIRRKTVMLRVNVWATDMPNAIESGKSIRNKICAEINRIIRQNRTLPNEVLIDSVGSGPNGQTQRVFSGGSEASPDAAWTELSDVSYQKLWYSDNDRCQISQSDNGTFATLLFRFKIDCRRNAIQEITFTFEGFGTAPTGDGVILKAWNNSVSEWQNQQSNLAGDADADLALTLSSTLSDYVDSNSYLWLLARTANPSNGDVPAVLFCDYVSCAVKVTGITYCDVSGYRNLDRVDVKPPIYRTEFAVKSWFIENIGV